VSSWRSSLGAGSSSSADASGRLTSAAAIVAIENSQRFAEAGRIDEAKEALTPVLNQGEPALAAKASWQLGILLFEQGDRDAARESFERAIKSDDPDASPRALNGLGVVLNADGDTEGAKKAFHDAMQTGHSDVAPKATRNLGVLLLRKGDLDGAQAAFERAIKSGHPEQAPKAEVYLGRVFEQRGNQDAAQAAYERALATTTDQSVREQATERLALLGVTQAAEPFESTTENAESAAEAEGTEYEWPSGPTRLSPLDEVIALAEPNDDEAVLERLLESKVYTLGSPAGHVSAGRGTESDVLHFTVQDEEGKETVLLPVFTQPQLMRRALLQNPQWQALSVLELNGRDLYMHVGPDVSIVINPWTRLQFVLLGPTNAGSLKLPTVDRQGGLRSTGNEANLKPNRR
jgi:Tfp pilus assembly protein PilF